MVDKKKLIKNVKRTRPVVRRGGKAAVGVGKMVSAAGYTGTGKKISQGGRVARDSSKVKDLKSAKKAIDQALKAMK